MDFSFSEFSDKFPGGTVKALEDEGCPLIVLSVDRHDLDGMKLKKSHVASSVS